MADDMKVGLTLEAEDRASPVVRRASEEAARRAERASTRSIRATNDNQRAQERAAVRQQSSEERAARAREQLGIRSERAIRREIQLTEAAYNRLARSGRLSATEQTRAYGQMQQKVAALRNEMSGLERQQRRGFGSTVMRVGAFAMQAGVPIGAGIAALSGPVRRTMSYDQQLRYMANTAFGDNGRQGREAGYKSIKDAVEATVSQVGGSRDEAAGALSTMLNAGAVSGDDALKLLPVIQKVSVGQGANSDDVAKLVNALVKTGGVKIEDIPKALDQFVMGAKSGPIEFADLARGMPQILAAAAKSGMKGIDDLPALLSMVEGSMATAGSPDQALTNAFNWLNKISSTDTAQAASKIAWKPGKGIDLVGQLAAYRAQGMNSLEGFDAIMNRVIATDPRVTKLEKQLRQANPADRQKILESQQALFEGSAIGQLLPDQRSALAYFSYRYSSPEERKKQISDIKNSGGANAEDLSFIKTGPSAGVQALKNQWEAGEFNAFKGFSDNLGDLAGKLAGLAGEYPSMTQAVVAVTAALTTLAAVAGSGALISMLRNGRGGRSGPILPGGGGGASGLATGGVVAAERASTGSSLVKRGFKRVGAAGPLLLAYGGYQAYQTATDPTLTSDQKTNTLIDQGARTGGSIGGAYAGAAAGTFLFPGVGTLIGGLAGGVGGDYLGGELAKYIQHLRGGDAAQAPNYQRQIDSLLAKNPGAMTQEQMRDAMAWALRESKKEPQKVDLSVSLDVNGGNIVAEVNKANERESWRH